MWWISDSCGLPCFDTFCPFALSLTIYLRFESTCILMKWAASPWNTRAWSDAYWCILMQDVGVDLLYFRNHWRRGSIQPLCVLTYTIFCFHSPHSLLPDFTLLLPLFLSGFDVLILLGVLLLCHQFLLHYRYKSHPSGVGITFIISGRWSSFVEDNLVTVKLGVHL